VQIGKNQHIYEIWAVIENTSSNFEEKKIDLEQNCEDQLTLGCHCKAGGDFKENMLKIEYHCYKSFVTLWC